MPPPRLGSALPPPSSLSFVAQEPNVPALPKEMSPKAPREPIWLYLSTPATGGTVPKKSIRLLRLVFKEIGTAQRWHQAYTKKEILCPLKGTSQKTRTLQQVRMYPFRTRSCLGVCKKDWSRCVPSSRI